MGLFSIAFIAFAGGLLSGVSGFGALIVMTPLFVLLLGLETAIPLGVVAGAALQISSFMAYRSHVRPRPLALMLGASLPGVWLGSSLLVHTPEKLLRAVLGVLIVAYVIWTLLKPVAAGKRAPGDVWACIAGFFSGLFGGAFGIAGPPAVMYVSRTGWLPDAIRGFLGVYFAVLFTGIALLQFAQGLITRDVLHFSAWVIPMCLAGGWAGRRIAARIKAHHYMRLILALLLFMGLSLCWPAVRELIGH